MSQLPHRRASPVGRIASTVVVVLLLLGGAGAIYYFFGRHVPGGSELELELADRGRIAVIGGDDLTRLHAEGAELLPASEIPGMPEALSGRDEAVLEQVFVDQGIAGVLVDGRGECESSESATIEQRLRCYANMQSLRGVRLTPSAALYERRRGLMLAPEMADVIARSARLLVGGSSTPFVRSFPEPIRRSRNVEVMVMLEEGGRPRLWRSARGGSIARALITAAAVARQRWTEREQAMGGPIDEVLPRLTLRVYLLEEDGTFDDLAPSFVERIFTDVHGVAFEHRGSWHYLLPRATAERGEGSAMAAYAELFDDAGLPRDSLGRDELRSYRLVARELGTSPARPSPPAGASPSEPISPDSILAPIGFDSL